LNWEKVKRRNLETRGRNAGSPAILAQTFHSRKSRVVGNTRGIKRSEELKKKKRKKKTNTGNIRVNKFQVHKIFRCREDR